MDEGGLSGNGPDVLRYKVLRSLERLKDLEDWRRTLEKDITQHGGRLTELEQWIVRLEKKIDRVNATLNRLLFTVAAGCIGVTLSVLVGSGKI